MAIAYIALGSNLGDRHAHISGALLFLGSSPHLTLLRVSTVLETPPMGPAQPDYLNAVAEIETALAPRALLNLLKAYERRAGRRRGERWGPRVIDLDIVMLGDVVLDEPGLTIPHKGLAERAFVLDPLMELAPELPVPGVGLTVAELHRRLREG